MMTIGEAFSEVADSLVGEGKGGQLVSIMESMGYVVPMDDTGPDCTFVPDEVKAIIGSLLVLRKDAAVSTEASNSLRDGVGRLLEGKPVYGMSESAGDADIDNNLDCI